jgi:putative SOS response-associated peptidase YedK
MCGRYRQARDPREVAEFFDTVNPFPDTPPRWNIAPTQDALVVRRHPETGARHLDPLRWGLVPHWAKDPSGGTQMINARPEAVAERTAFRVAFARRRCLVPADGFYEWTKAPGGGKQAWHLRPRHGGVLAFAGLWESWRPRGEGDRVVSATIVTTEANATVAPVHDRMPVCLPPETWDEWLDPGNDDTDTLGKLLVPAPASLITMHPVGTDVGNVRNRGPHLTEEIPPEATLELGGAGG